MIIQLLAINLNQFSPVRQGLFSIIKSFHIDSMNCQLSHAGVALLQMRERQEKGMKKVAIVGLGWLGMPLALALSARGWQVTGSKTTQDGVEAARMCGIDSYMLQLTPELVCDTDDLDALMNVDALVITLPARRSGPGGEFYMQAMQEIVDSALAHRIPRIIFTSSTSVYGDVAGTVKEDTARHPVTTSGRVLKDLEDWLHNLPGTSVDILRLAGLVGPGRHPGRFFAGKTAPNGQHGVNLVHLDDVVGAITLLLQAPKGGHIYNICAPAHPARSTFYPAMARQLDLPVPQFTDARADDKGKIVDGSRITKELGFDYQYPDPLLMPMDTATGRD